MITRRGGGGPSWISLLAERGRTNASSPDGIRKIKFPPGVMPTTRARIVPLRPGRDCGLGPADSLRRVFLEDSADRLAILVPEADTLPRVFAAATLEEDD